MSREDPCSEPLLECVIGGSCVQRVGWVNGMGCLVVTDLVGHLVVVGCLVIVLRCCECPQVHVGLCTVYCKVQPCAVHTFLADCCEWCHLHVHSLFGLCISCLASC